MSFQMKKVLFVLTNHGELGDSGIPTGWYLPEVAHPYNILCEFYEIFAASPKGGNAPMDPASQEAYKDDAESIRFLANPSAQWQMRNPRPLGTLNPADYAAVFYPGGHGPMFDLAEDPVSLDFAQGVYEAGGIVAGVCHGPAGFANTKLTNGEYLVNGKNVTAFTNSEEDVTDKTKYMPFLLEDRLKANGAIFQSASDWTENVVVDGQLITGQNPASAGLVAHAIHKALG